MDSVYRSCQITPDQKITVAIAGVTDVSGQVEVQFWKALGATEVIAIEKPSTKLEKTKECGAAAAIPLAEKLEEIAIKPAGNLNNVHG
jgi:D-arabinose 1-dehydrogenase-like Zn-dependent alcohol dehydrogenase